MSLEPALLWTRFEELCRIPRESGHEERVQAHIVQFAESQGFAVARDAVGNVVVTVPGRGRGVYAPIVVIQGHTDMVCVKAPGSNHDFTRDPIITRREWREENGKRQEVLLATDTTLGADNGLGVAAALAVATDPEITDCPPLELLVTIDEERGLTGASQLDATLLKGRLLINLDTEELGEICISCAGGRDLFVRWPVERREPTPGSRPITLRLSGLPGGHSGVQIHEGRGNAIQMLLTELSKVADLDKLQLSSFIGGSKRNVIPSDATLTLWADPETVRTLTASLADPAVLLSLRSGVRVGAENILFSIEEADPATTLPPLTARASTAILQAIAALPHGPQVWSEVVPGLVETSNNVAVLTTTETEIALCCATRSSRDGAIAAFQEAVTPALERSGAKVTHGDGYPGWAADPDNPLLQQAQRTFTAVLGAPPKIIAVHAGLECGVLKGKIPELRMISFGPDIRDAHTIQERVLLDSVPPFYRCLKTLLQDLAG